MFVFGIWFVDIDLTDIWIYVVSDEYELLIVECIPPISNYKGRGGEYFCLQFPFIRKQISVKFDENS